MKFIRLTEEKITSSQKLPPTPSRAKPPNKLNSKLAFAIALALSHNPIYGATITADGTTCTLADAITAANTDAATGGCTAGSGDDTISITNNVTLSARLPFIKSNIIFEGNSNVVDGASTYRVFFTKSGNVTFQNMTIQNGQAQGGDGNSGGGGGAGLGAGLFIYDGAVTIDTVTFANNSATGGNGGSGSGGGGGGMRGNGGTGGGGGFGGNGGDKVSNQGGNGGGINIGDDGANGPNGGANGNYGQGGFGDGSNGYGSYGNSGSGGSGGFGGGGGGGGYGGGGFGGFGGGGGGSNNGFGGNGGFGGGGGDFFGYGGFGGGGGGSYSYSNGGFGGGGGSGGSGGGGAGFGGAIFAKAGTLTFNTVTFNNNSTTGGTGANNGQGKGGAIFICTNTQDPSCSASVSASACGVTFSSNTAPDAAGSGNDTVDHFGDIQSATTACPAAPNAPTGLTATAASQTQIDLSWTDESGDETGFKIYRDNVELTPSPKVGTDTTTFSDTGLTCGTTYSYEVKATNVGSDSTGVTTSGTTQSCPVPNAPTGLTATAASQTQIDLSWTDESGDETGFKIFRDNVELTPSPKVGTDTTTFSDTGLTCDTTYSYEVKATNADSDSTSVITSVTTQSCPVSNTPIGSSGMSPLPRTMRIFVKISGSGMVSSDPDGINCGPNHCQTVDYNRNITGLECEPDYCTGEFETNTTVLLTPTPDEDFVFTGWGGHPDCVESDSELTSKPLLSNRLCIAFFQKIRLLTVTKTGDGELKFYAPYETTCENDTCTAWYSNGMNIFLRALSNEESGLVTWGGDCRGGSQWQQIRMMGDKVCTVTFE